MSPQPRSAESIYFAALEQASPEQRAAYLDDACGGDAQLRQQVERLLRTQVHVGDFPEVPCPDPGRTDAYAPLREGAGAMVGPYKLLEPIGEGGMGNVWMAQQTEPVKRLVAVKLIKPGMDSKAVLARFEAERQALAIMDHPNIAKVFDGGVVSGRPYFVMELVKGVPITTFCDDRKLTPRERLALFLPVCQAVQHAHQKGVIHRDLKPSNVLVAMYDEKPVPKVIDFGVAKATGQPLTERTLHTGFGAVVGTVEYMSPEQASFNQLDIDTRSDIYSLGVLLYELLTGSTPFPRKELEKVGLLEVFRVIREQEPPRPSTKLSTSEGLPTLAANRGTEPGKLTRLVRGELDWIVMKALDKDRNRRYETANGFAQDVQRFLDDEPILAGPPSAAYRLRKFVKRNRGPVLAAALVGLALVSGIVGTTLGLVEAWRQRDAAQEARSAAEQSKEKAKEEAENAKKAGDEARRLVRQEKAARERAESARHAIQLDLAHRAWEQHDVARAEEILGEVFEPLRNTWEQRHLAHLCRRKALPLVGHKEWILSIAFSGDGRRIVSASRDGVVKVWDAQAGREILSVQTSPGDRIGVAFSRDGTRIAASTSVDRKEVAEVKVWDAATGEEKLTVRGPSSGGVALSREGARVASTWGDVVKVWDVASSTELHSLKGHKGRVSCVAFSGDGQRLVSGGSDGAVKVWDMQTGQEKRTFPGASPLRSVTFSPDDRRVVSGRQDGTVKVWDARSGKQTFSRTVHQSPINSIAMSGDGKCIVSASGAAGYNIRSASPLTMFKVWDADTGKELLTLRGHTGLLVTVCFSPDGKRIASAGWDRTIRLWGLPTTQEKLSIKLGRPLVCPDGEHLILMGGVHSLPVKVLDPATGKERFSLKGLNRMVSGVALSGDGRRILFRCFGEDDVIVWDTAADREVCTVKGDGTMLITAAMSVDGSRLVLANIEGTVKVVDAATGRVRYTIKGKNSGPIFGLAFDHGGKRYATAAGWDGSVKVWDAETGQEKQVFKGHSSRVRGLAFSLDGRRLVTASDDGTVRLWDLEAGEEKLSLKGHLAEVTSVAISPDGQRIASGSQDMTVKLWDVATGQEKLTLKGHTSPVESVAFNADGQRIVSLDQNKTVKVWEAPPAPQPKLSAGG